MSIVLAELTATLEALVAQPALFHEASFAARSEALDALELHVLFPLDGLPLTAEMGQLLAQAQDLQARLEAVNEQLFQRLRAEIRAGRHTPASLRALLLAYAGPLDAAPAVTSYDHLDALTNGLFPEPVRLQAEAHDPEMVYYQKTPARIIFALAARLAPADVLYDLGSGLGQVPLLVHLLSGATARGIEIEPSYCRHARHCAVALNLPQVQFRCADARTADLADATAFYLFTPFTGSIMREVLARLRVLAQRRPLRLFSYGPSTEALRQQPWLRRVGEKGQLYQLAEFRTY